MLTIFIRNIFMLDLSKITMEDEESSQSQEYDRDASSQGTTGNIRLKNTFNYI